MIVSQSYGTPKRVQITGKQNASGKIPFDLPLTVAATQASGIPESSSFAYWDEPLQGQMKLQMQNLLLFADCPHILRKASHIPRKPLIFAGIARIADWNVG